MMIQGRLDVLRQEFNKGQQQLALLDRKRAETRDTMLRIAGAIQVLEEILQQDRALCESAS
ncbi:MAG TPA: hypothetical protein VKU01_09850 [Bryobacteraceae bacterium]|nr:hypothetical protein [Bryobacteraceae bacterium]